MKIYKIIAATTAGLSCAFLLLIFGISWAISIYCFSAGREQLNVEQTLVEIPYGSSLRRVSDILAANRVIKSPKKFYWYVRLGRMDGLKFQAGYYDFFGVLTHQQIADRLLSGKDQSFKITFKEGQTIVDLVNMLEAADLVTKDQFIAAMTNEEIINRINPKDGGLRKNLLNDVGGLEGYLFPDTYFFSKRDSAESIIKKMHQRLLFKLNDQMKARIQEINTSLHEVLTLAAIIEKETGNESERPIISSVYHNRLKLGMRLQADPTVIYGIKDYDGKIKKAHLLAHHPYNTYQITGLPPGPIAAPGIKAIEAALWPADTKYLYFVSKNDGSHVFCENLNCHNQAVRKWQIDYFRKAAKS